MDSDVNEELYDYAPAKIMGFVKVGNALSCIVRPCSITHSKSNVFLIKWSLAFWDRGCCNLMINLVSVDAILQHCLMIPVQGENSVVYHEMHQRDRWAYKFHKDL